MRGQEPVVICRFETEGAGVEEILLEAFRHFAGWALEQEERECP